jgi:hypothetical protein
MKTNREIIMITMFLISLMLNVILFVSYKDMCNRATQHLIELNKTR